MMTRLHRQPDRFLSNLLFVIILLSMLLAGLWIALILWFHVPQRWTWVAILSIASVASVGGRAFWVWAKCRQSARKWLFGYGMLVMLIGGWFLSLQPEQDRDWRPEVKYSVSAKQDNDEPNLITLHHVRDFGWQRHPKLTPLTAPNSDMPVFDAPAKLLNSNASNNDKADELIAESIVQQRWISRTVNLDDLEGMNVINSYWMGRPIAHTLVSFNFANAEPITFSFEIRKEMGESFSTFGGFVRRFELALIASTERDIVFTRSNARGEQVYVFPIDGVNQQQMQAMFLQYVQVANELQQKPRWYNTLTANCTNLIFYMARDVMGKNGDNAKLPYDFRIWASGYLPEYLLEQGLLTTSKWHKTNLMKQAYVNPSVYDLTQSDVQTDVSIYSRQMRENLP